MAAFSLTFKHLAGSRGGAGYEDGAGSVARFHGAAGVAVDPSGNLYIADTANHTIRRVTPSGDVSTIAGMAETPGTEDGYRFQARFRSPRGIAIDGGGNLYVSDTGNHTIRKIDPYGVVTTIAGFAGSSGWVDATGSAARFNAPSAVAAVGADLYVADTGNHRIRRIATGGVVSTFAGSGAPGGTNGTGTAASFDSPMGIVYRADNATLYVADTYNSTIRDVTVPGAAVGTFAGLLDGYGHQDGFPGKLALPRSIAIRNDDTLVVADMADHTIRTVSTSGTLGTLAGTPLTPGTADGTTAAFNAPEGVAALNAEVYVADTGNHSVRAIAVGPPAVTSTRAGRPNAAGFVGGAPATSLFRDPSGISLYPGPPDFGYAVVADTGNNAIRRVYLNGNVDDLAGGVFGYANGNGAAAQFRNPRGIAINAADGSMYVADTGNHVIRRVDYSGNVTLVAGQPGVPGNANGSTATATFNAPQALAYRYPYVYVADTGNYLVRRIDLNALTVSTFAGSGTFGSTNANGTSASFGALTGITIDMNDNLYVAESQTYTIRKITPEADVTTFAGSCCGGPADGIGTAARFGYPGPTGVSADPSSVTSASVADPRANVIRAMNLSTANVVTAGGRIGQPGTSDGTGTGARFTSPAQLSAWGETMVLTDGHSIRIGGPEIGDLASIDSQFGKTGIMRQLTTSPQTATEWQWDIIRRPAGSTATLSSSTVMNPTFVPDVSDVYVFRCTATSSAGSRISTVTLQVNGAADILDASYPGPHTIHQTFPFTVTAYDEHGLVADGYTGTVQFSSSDPLATLPADYTFTISDHGTHTFDISMHTLGSQWITVSDTVDGTLFVARDVEVSSTSIAAPSSVTATASGGGPWNVLVSWPAVAGADHYLVERKSGSGAYVLRTSVSGTSYNDTSITAGQSYFFRVIAVHSSGVPSDPSIPDPATAMTFADSPLVVGGVVRAAHLTQLRTAANALRAAAGLAPFAFSEPTITAGVTRAKALHITQLRSVIDSARDAVGAPTPAYTDPTLTAGTSFVRAVHFNELQNRVK